MAFCTLRYDNENVIRERHPLLKGRPSQLASWGRLSMFASTIIIIVVTAFCLTSPTTSTWIRGTRLIDTKTIPSDLGPERSKFCVAHAAYGSEYKQIAAMSAVTKKHYADLHGYKFLQYIGDTLDEFVHSYCPELAGQIELAYSRTTPVKSCGIWAALRDSCDYVLWTDADSVIVDSSIKMEDLLYLDHPKTAANLVSEQFFSDEDLQKQADALHKKDVLFFLESYSALGLCSGLTQRSLNLGACGLPDEFANCVNTGAMIMRSGPFAETFLRDQLALAVFDNEFLLHSPCSTNNLGTGFAKNLTWDQCMFRGETEQCTLSCLYRQNPKLLENTMCRISDDISTHFLFGRLLDPPKQTIDSLRGLYDKRSQQYTASGETSSWTSSLSGVPHPYKGTLVYNCMGGDSALKMDCVTRATYLIWPEMIPTEDYAPPRPDNLPVGELPDLDAPSADKRVESVGSLPAAPNVVQEPPSIYPPVASAPIF
uniref:Nucleotide-diphospho-sugar transferase domain-containing protein n=1 Tax=Aureoumbra lagunensis TaxID=44058 RepID=A0A7S3JWD9_9STRA|eukprot:CAMPEP_0197315670 /NCGR_PEP_ID=MMETSP0891-20130614/39319_1 /TAXON_ID=44058 ORGANISM="Aureoumbra lagunensis, Strain CCMP1510" /NCGR_SAMPLE_ID=MMETSP0891 /ASSEMBLY_ACC=CAM_ASM_000534 /LENGTH=483 /DNA_ID=CAMNT_0042804775 /DNA_START=14 /DNA_END=1465 /DNA_ORIENTATION=+